MIERSTCPPCAAPWLVWAAVWFVLGYALYATVFGALGSLASRPEDAAASPARSVSY